MHHICPTGSLPQMQQKGNETKARPNHRDALNKQRPARKVIANKFDIKSFHAQQPNQLFTLIRHAARRWRHGTDHADAGHGGFAVNRQR